MAGIRAEDGIEGHGRHQSVKETLGIAGIEELAADEASKPWRWHVFRAAGSFAAFNRQTLTHP